MRRFAVLSVAALLVSAYAAPSRAAEDCPDGDWFCDPTPIPEQPAPEPGAASPPTPVESSPFEPAPPPPDRGTVRIDVERVRPAVPRKPRRFREWGVNMHATLGLMANDDAADEAGMNGLGAALRFRPIPHIAIEGALELAWGVDYNGYDRFEHAVLVNGLFFANPRSAIQLYGIAGLSLGAAYLDSAGADGIRTLRDETYTYVGGQLGLGVEARVTRHFAVGGDLIGFIRERNDRNAEENPEFVEPDSQRTTNTSGGGLVRLGATFYW